MTDHLRTLQTLRAAVHPPEPSQLASILEYLQCRECLFSAFLRGPLRLCVNPGLPNPWLRCRRGGRVFRNVPPITVREPCHFTYYRVGMPKLDLLTVRCCRKYPVCRVLMVSGPQDRLPRNWHCYGQNRPRWQCQVQPRIRVIRNHPFLP